MGDSGMVGGRYHLIPVEKRAQQSAHRRVGRAESSVGSSSQPGRGSTCRGTTGRPRRMVVVEP